MIVEMSQMKSPRFKPHSVTVMIDNSKYPEIKEWLIANIGPKGSNPKGTNLWFGKWYAHEYDRVQNPRVDPLPRAASHIIFYGKNAKDDATLFKLTWGGDSKEYIPAKNTKTIKKS